MGESQNIEYKESWRDEYLKWICGFANSQGGILYVGIKDNGKICGVSDSKKLMEDLPNKIASTLGLVCEVNLLAKNGTEYIEIIVPQSNVPVSYHGVYHVRSGATKQELQGVSLQNFLLKKMGLTWDKIVQENASIEEIDRNAVEYFLKQAVSCGRMNSAVLNDSTENVLENLNLVDENKKLTNAAILLFGKDPAKYFPLCDFRIGRFGTKQSDLMFQDVIEGNLIQMADKVVDILKAKYLVSPIHYEGLTRIESLEIPEDALREAILNSIIHKDYSGAHIQMKIYNDCVELWNDGSLPENWTVEDLTKKHNSKPRNPNIANVFYKAGFIENWGRGIDKICDCLKNAKMKAPVFESNCGGVLLTIYRKNNFVSSEGTEFTVLESSENRPDNSQKTAQKTVQKILDYLAENPTATIVDLQAVLNKANGTIKEHITKLKQSGRLERVGGDNGGYWKVMNNVE